MNPERRARERVRQFGDLADYVASLPCAIAGCGAWSVPAHVRTRRNAGAWIEVDGEPVGNLANLCEPHHREQHDAGIRTFERRHGLDLAAIAAVNGRAFRQLGDVHGAPF